MALRVIDLFPASWLDPAMKSQVIDYIARLPIDPEDRKGALLDWCRAVKADCNVEDYARVTGLPPGEV